MKELGSVSRKYRALHRVLEKCAEVTTSTDSWQERDAEAGVPLFSLRPHVPHPCCLPQMALTPPFKLQLPEASCRGTEWQPWVLRPGPPWVYRTPTVYPKAYNLLKETPCPWCQVITQNKITNLFTSYCKLHLKKEKMQKKKKNPNMLFLALAELLADSLCLPSFPQREGRKSEGRPQFHFMKRLGFLT